MGANVGRGGSSRAACSGCRPGEVVLDYRAVLRDRERREFVTGLEPCRQVFGAAHVRVDHLSAVLLFSSRSTRCSSAAPFVANPEIHFCFRLPVAGSAPRRARPSSRPLERFTIEPLIAPPSIYLGDLIEVRGDAVLERESGGRSARAVTAASRINECLSKVLDRKYEIHSCSNPLTFIRQQVGSPKSSQFRSSPPPSPIHRRRIPMSRRPGSVDGLERHLAPTRAPAPRLRRSRVRHAQLSAQTPYSSVFR